MSETFAAPPVEDVVLDFELTVGDLRSAMIARARTVRRARVMNWVLVAALVMMAWGLTLEIFRDGVGGVPPKDWGLALFLVVFAALQLFGLQAHLARGRLQQHGRRRVSLNSQGVTCVGEQTATTQAWPQFSCYLEREQLFVLLSQDQRCLTVLPKRGLAAPTEADRLRALLDARLPRA
ncbi:MULTISPECIES: YcxB family protein [Streptomyces]|uniref:YcxB family protein n=1 Tax=Streptomyces luteosporeus TaxID=173856 RepID=A0ABP6G4B8_9ACTN